MIAVVQRVSQAEVRVETRIVGAISHGLLVLLGIARGDTDSDVTWMANRIAKLRIFPDQAEKMNFNIQQCCGSVLLVSQFTLLADLSSGHRPGFSDAEEPKLAKIRCDEVAQSLTAIGIATSQGEFGASMLVSLVNDGPVTIILNSRSCALE